MIFTNIFNKINTDRLTAAFVFYFFFGVFISPFYQLENEDKNTFGGNHRDTPSAITNGDLWTSADNIVRISTKPLADGKGFQNHDLKYLVSNTYLHSTFFPEYYQFAFLTPIVVSKFFSQTSPRSPPTSL